MNGASPEKDVLFARASFISMCGKSAAGVKKIIVVHFALRARYAP